MKASGNDAFEVDIEGTKENGFATEWLGRTAAPIQAGESNKLGTCEEARGMKYWTPVIIVRALYK